MPDDLGIPGLEDAEWVGSGSFSMVYKAREPQFQWLVAVKVLTVTPDDQTLHLFEREQKTLGSVSGHPNIVRLLGAGITAGHRPYLKMEYLGRGSLGDQLTKALMPADRVMDIGVKMCGALARAHELNVLHRDIKPANILVSDWDEPKLADFGVARFQEGPSMTAALIGTAAFAAPEAVDGGAPTRRSDIWSLAATLHTLLSGTPPFGRLSSGGLFALGRRIATDPPADLRPFGVPLGLIEVLNQAMAKDPAERYEDAVALGRALQAIQRERGPAVTALVLPDVALDRVEASPDVQTVVVPPSVAELAQPDLFMATPLAPTERMPHPPATSAGRRRGWFRSKKKSAPAAPTPTDLGPEQRAAHDASMRDSVLEQERRRQEEADELDRQRVSELDANHAIAEQLIDEIGREIGRQLEKPSAPDNNGPRPALDLGQDPVPAAPAAQGRTLEVDTDGHDDGGPIAGIPRRGVSEPGDALSADAELTLPEEVGGGGEAATPMAVPHSGPSDLATLPPRDEPGGLPELPGGPPEIGIDEPPLSGPVPLPDALSAESAAPPSEAPPRLEPPQPAPDRSATGRRYVVTRPTSEPVRVEVVDARPELSPSPGAHASDGDRGLSIHLEDLEVQVDPGRIASASMTVSNTGAVPEHIDLQVRGLAPEWIDVEPASLALPPGAGEVITISFAPPRTSDAAARKHPYSVVVWSTANPRVRCEERGSLDVLPFHRLLAVLDQPDGRGRAGTTHRLTVTNRGNATATTPVRVSGPPELGFSCLPSHLTIAPGDSARSDIHVEARSKKAFGRSQTYSYTVSVEDMDGPIPFLATFTQLPFGRSG